MGTCERMLRVEAPAEVVWGWLSRPRNLFSVNLFHAEVHSDETELREGAVIPIDHDFFGAVQQKRQAKILEVRPYFVRFGEHKTPGAPGGRDPFPHNQSFQVVPVDDSSCILVNRITGRYVFPGSGLFGERLFRRYMPFILDDDNQVIAVGCGAMEPAKVKVPKGLILWPAMVASTRFLKKSTRRQVLEKMKAERAAPAAGSEARAGV
jgi:ligand-binding SRPBCC domain-containing protein